MRGLVIRWVVSALALYLTALLAQQLNIGIILEGTWTPFLVAAALGIINALIRPLVVLLTLPLNCLTLGLFTFVINALLFWLVGAGWIPDFRVDGFLPALFGSIVMGVISGLANHMIKSKV